MNFLLFFLGLLLGAVAAWIYFHNTSHKEDQNQLQKLSSNLALEKEKRFQAEIELRSFRNSQADTLRRMQDTFDALAANALQKQIETFGVVARQTLEQQISKANDDYEHRGQAIAQMVKPVSEALDKYEKMVREFQLGNSNAVGALKSFMEELGQSQQKLTKETQSLVNALKAPKVRGRWGEIGLKRVIEYSGLNKYCDFTQQQQLTSADNVLRPDLIIHLPANRKVVVDSKVPLSAYLEMIEHDDEALNKDLLHRHVKAVQQHVKDLSSKAYWAQLDGAVDFVVLYIEVEPAFGAALAENKEIISDALANRIVFATPSTLVSLLQTIAYTWKQHSANENAQEILKASKDLHERLLVFSRYYQQLGNQINTMVKTFNQSVSSWESRVMPGIRKVEELDGNKQEEAPALSQINTDARTMNS